MNKLFYILTIVCFAACDKTDKSNEVDDLQFVKIEFANATIGIPRRYKLKSPEQLRGLLNSGKQYNEISETIQKIDAIKSIPTAFEIYVDTLNLDNNIWFQQGEHVRLTKSVSKQYLAMLETQLQKLWTPQGIKFERVESKYLSGAEVQLVKLKYKLTREALSAYTTQYLVSSNLQTLAIVINNSNSEDLEGLIRDMRMK